MMRKGLLRGMAMGLLVASISVAAESPGGIEILVDGQRYQIPRGDAAKRVAPVRQAAPDNTPAVAPIDATGTPQRTVKVLPMPRPLAPGLPLGPRVSRVYGGGPLPPLPDDMTVSITKSGKKAAEIVVHQGDKKWEATENDLGRLPAHARAYAERMLGMPWSGEKAPGLPKLPEVPNVEERILRFPAGANVEKRLEEMSQRIDKLQSAVEELRHGTTQQKKK